ncbi:cytochrome P450 [Sporormia fimetaria CBS 119925]|uniref:Cytochrome P450 n=1 Tax=Sporormia fimetaria CBS 119925 TaxID=1340428 RepID=A0A6A6V3Y8_9PLEO|nr:cytochrome P450 [Sporormia fimetaria CBS 119925]
MKANKSSKANVKRSGFYDYTVRNENERSTIAHTEPAAHAKRRKLLNQAFTEKSLRASAEFMSKHIDRWLEILVDDVQQNGWTEPKDAANEVEMLVWDILGDICNGREFGMKEKGKNMLKLVPHASVKQMQYGYPVLKMPFAPFLRALSPLGVDEFMAKFKPPEIKLYEHFTADAVAQRLARFRSGKDERQDMFHFICKAKDPETGLPAFSDRDIIAEARLLTVAGSDTSSVGMTGALFFLAKYPERLEKLRREIDSVFGTEEIVAGLKVKSCEYLRAVIDEVLRICPAGLAEMPREVLPGGIVINEEFYPAGTIVGTGVWCDNDNKEVYGDPEIFRPERWIPSPENPPEEISRIKAAFTLLGSHRTTVLE